MSYSRDLQPYTQQAATQPPTELEGYYAGFVSRLLALLADIFAMTVFTAGNTLVLNAVMSFFGVREDPIIGVVAQLYIVLLGFLTPPLYLYIFWRLAGQTPGKALLGIKIVDTSGKQMRPRQVIIRMLGYVASSAGFLGFMWVLLDNERRGLHDRLAGTMVIYSDKTRLHRAIVNEVSRLGRRS